MERRSRQIRNPTLGFQLAIVMCVAIGVSGLWLELPEKNPEQISVGLLLETPVSIRVNGRQKRTFQFRIESDQYFRILVHGLPTEVSLSLYGPDHQVNRSIGCLQGD